MDDEEVQKNKRLEKKRRLKERFDTEYDDGDATYFDDLKEEMQKQAEVDCPSVWRSHLRLCLCLIFFHCLFSWTELSLKTWTMSRECSMKASGQECTSD